ncbi:MAG: biotin--[acetyl-CoA-carboxylase] ligase [Gemmatimonadetes bacterium]|nr:biotin--[acetyl-CoA-carboxylase] ligase [Gemmatimonadota bacterium]
MPASGYDGASAGEVARRCGVPSVLLFSEVGSTMDVAHELAADGAVAGTLVIAEQQQHGRGRGGHGWQSAAGGTIAMSLIERPDDPAAIGVLSLRLGLHAARVLVQHAPDLLVKWPNDLMRSEAKVGGILVEARWHGVTPDWVVIGFGLNVRERPWPGSAALDFDGSRVEILEALVPAFRAAAAAHGGLTEAERSDWRRRDWAAGRAVVMPARGVVRGVDEDGSLIVDGAAGPMRCTSGSLVLAEESGDATRL